MLLLARMPSVCDRKNPDLRTRDSHAHEEALVGEMLYQAPSPCTHRNCMVLLKISVRCIFWHSCLCCSNEPVSIFFEIDTGQNFAVSNSGVRTVCARHLLLRWKEHHPSQVPIGVWEQLVFPWNTSTSTQSESALKVNRFSRNAEDAEKRIVHKVHPKK